LNPNTGSTAGGTTVTIAGTGFALGTTATAVRDPNGQTQRRLRLALQIAQTITDADGPEVTRAWFQGLNPQLDDQSPARLLREGDIDEVGPEIIAAERAFLVGG
jgi:hypothetical protein